MYNEAKVAPMKTKEDIQVSLARLKEMLRREYGVTEIGLFGSCVRGEQGPESDVDILVSFEKPVSLLTLVALENRLCDLLGVRVDVVPKDDVRAELKDEILTSAVYI